MLSLLLFLLLLLERLHGLSLRGAIPLWETPSGIAPRAGVPVCSSTPGNVAYAANYGSAASVDQAAYESADFWKQVADELPGFYDAPELARYRGWVANLIQKPQGETDTLETGQEILTQYVFPGLQGNDSNRQAFPVLPEIEDALRALAPTAQEELASLLAARPLVDDDAPAAQLDDGEAEAEPWNRAAWYGWQFMSLRDAKPWMPRTIRALEESVCVLQGSEPSTPLAAAC